MGKGKNILVKKGIEAIFFFLILLVIKAIPTVAETPDVRTKVPHINAYEALELYKSGRLILLDVHPDQGKVRSQIVGAFYFPADKIDKIELRLPKTMSIGVFCD